MQLDGDRSTEVDVFAYSLDFGGLMVVPGANALADDIPVCTAGYEGEFLKFHNVGELIADFAGSTKSFGLEEVLDAPTVVVVVHFPLCVYVEKS